jgi:hypothetical protein
MSNSIRGSTEHNPSLGRALVQQPALSSCSLDRFTTYLQLAVAFPSARAVGSHIEQRLHHGAVLGPRSVGCEGLDCARHFGSAHRRLIFASLCARCFRFAYMRLVGADRCLRSFVIAFLDQPCAARETSDRPIDAWHVPPRSQSAAHDTPGLLHVWYCRRTAHVNHCDGSRATFRSQHALACC